MLRAKQQEYKKIFVIKFLSCRGDGGGGAAALFHMLPCDSNRTKETRKQYSHLKTGNLKVWQGVTMKAKQSDSLFGKVSMV